MSDKIKEEGQVFTPSAIVTMILDTIKYNGKTILTKTIMEPSFGEGVFLIEIVERIIHEAQKNAIESNEIEKIINNNVYGIEKDEVLYKKCIEKLNNLLEAYSLHPIKWDNLVCGDTTIEYKKHIGRHNFVVGNPPYVRIHNFTKELIENTKNFKFIDGDTDLYICFYEMGINMLNETGRLGFITPNSFMKNSSQKKFRDYIIDNEYLQAIYDFKTSEIFKGFNTYTCICILNKNKDRINKKIDYKEYNMYDIVVSNMIDYSYFKNQLKSKSWNLSSEEDIKFLELNKNKAIKLGNIAVVQNGVATNRDSVYIGLAYEDEEKTIPYMGKHTDKKKIVYFNNEKIESTILHRCVKASKYDGIMTNMYILFPYKGSTTTKYIRLDTGNVIENNYIPITEEELKKKYPNAYKYLQDNWDTLSTRDMDKNAEWYVFGRSQGLLNMPYKKIVFKHIVNKDNTILNPYILDEDVVVYSGMYTTININSCIQKNKNNYSFNQMIYDKELEEILNVFKEEDFKKYISLIGKDMAGGYVGISSKHIQGYGTNLATFPNFPVEIPKEDIGKADNNYMNNLFTKEFLKCINESYDNMGIAGKTSSERVKPFHSFLAKILQYKLGQDYEVIAAGFGVDKEMNIESTFNNKGKNVDVCVLKNNKPVGAIAFKLMSNNFKQNFNNYVEGMLGETTEMHELGIPYAFCYLVPEKALYLTSDSKFDHIDVLTQENVSTFYNIAKDEEYRNRTPDVMFLGFHKLFDDKYLESLKSGDKVDIGSKEYLDAIKPEWSSLDFVKDEDVKNYFLEENNIGNFLDNLIKKIENK